MIPAVLGIVALVLALFAVGGFMEGDMGKVGKFGAGFAVCAALILMTAGPHSGDSNADDDCVRYSQFATTC